MILVTGGAGFIGSNLHAALVRRGLEAAVIDQLGSGGKWRNLAKHPPARLRVNSPSNTKWSLATSIPSSSLMPSDAPQADRRKGATLSER